MIRTTIVGAVAASLFVTVAPTAQAQGLGALGDVFNCSNRGSQQTPGALVGGVLGGLAGAGVAKNDTVGALLGAAVGAAAGSWVGCRLGGRDQASLEDATMRALNEGRNTDWSNPQTGASARINIYADSTAYRTPPRYGERMRYGQVRLGQRVNASANYLTTAPAYTAVSQTYIRTAPRTNAPTNGLLRRGEQFQALARVEGSNWILVGRNGEGVGYVPGASAREVVETVTYAPYVEPIAREAVRLNPGVVRAAAYETSPTLFSVNSNANLRANPSTSARSLGMVYRGDEIEAVGKVQGSPWILVARNGVGAGYVHQSMLTALEVDADYGPGSGYPASSGGNGYQQASADCRIVEQVVTTRDYQTQTQRYRACRDGAGRWNMVAA